MFGLDIITVSASATLRQIFMRVYYGCIVSLFSINGPCNVAKWGMNSQISKSNTMHLASNAEGDMAALMPPSLQTPAMGNEPREGYTPIKHGGSIVLCF